MKRALSSIVRLILQFLGIPAIIREFEFVDPATNQSIYLTTTKNYSILAVGHRHLYFNRLTGKFDGIGLIVDEDSLGI